MSKEELETLVNKIKDGLDETASALVSEDLLAIVSNYNLLVDSIAEKDVELAKLKEEKEELLKVNGRLFQKIGFDKEEAEEETAEDKAEEEIKIEDIIDEKGDLK
jgi:negative regulator of genetic competence, sporulation and motility